MTGVRQQWLDTQVEPALEPELAICDPHHHFWTHDGVYLLEDYLRDIGGGHRVLASVFVTCDAMFRTDGPEEMRPLGETAFVEDQVRGYAPARAGMSGPAAGIVAHADLSLGDKVARVLDEHLEISPMRLRGIRHSVNWDAHPEVRNNAPRPRPGWLLDAGYQAGVRALGRYGLTFDAWLFHPQLPELATLARACPGTTIVLNHMGGVVGVGPYAGRRAEVFARWKREIEALALCDNVLVKLGGMGLVRAGFGWHERVTPVGSEELASVMGPYIHTCIDAFGPARCMFESNFPADKVSYGYNVVWNAFKRMTAGFATAERAALFQDTAKRAYRLGMHAT